jgi:hypothetical protein
MPIFFSASYCSKDWSRSDKIRHYIMQEISRSLPCRRDDFDPSTLPRYVQILNFTQSSLAERRFRSIDTPTICPNTQFHAAFLSWVTIRFIDTPTICPNTQMIVVPRPIDDRQCVGALEILTSWVTSASQLASQPFWYYGSAILLLLFLIRFCNSFKQN